MPVTASVDCVSSRCIGLIFWTFILSFVAVAADALLPLVPPPRRLLKLHGITNQEVECTDQI